MTYIKKSKYNRIIPLNSQKSLIFNSISCGLAVIENLYIDLLNKNDAIYPEDFSDNMEVYDNLLKGNFIVSDDIDEFKILQHNFEKSKYDNSILSLTIAPTLDCNFSCEYCYEENKSLKMNSSTIESLIEFIKNNIKSNIKLLDITWYGGEPLLAIDIIVELSEKMISVCKDNNIKYSAYMVSNGYNLNKEVISLLEKCYIVGLQVTLDGLNDIHDKRRCLIDGTGTFSKIMESVVLLNENENIQTEIRINVDKTNLKNIYELLDYFDKNNLKNLGIHLGQVHSYTNQNASVRKDCLGEREFFDEEMNLAKYLYNKGFMKNRLQYYPKMKRNFCGCTRVSSFIIGPEGEIYKCWNDMGNQYKVVGSIEKFKYDSLVKNKCYIDYIMWSPFEQRQCTECGLLPICMGGCPYAGIKASPSCERWQYVLEDRLLYIYNEKLKEQKIIS